MPEKVDLANITVVLNRPRYPENIGAAARAICNMGIHRLVVVDPENYDRTRIERMATHAARDAVDGIVVADRLEEALADYQYVVGTTARLGGQRQAVVTPPKLSEKLVTLSRSNQVALLFGPEDRGLTNDEIRLCHILVTIPTAAFSSLNLAQAVMVICYEVFKASLDEKVEFAPRLAAREELEQMYDQLKEILVRISFINAENPDYWINGLRRFFNRLPLRAKEVRMIRGICRQINWYGRKSYEEGLSGRPRDANGDPGS